MQIDYARRVLHFAKLLIVYFYLPAMAYGWNWSDVNDVSDYARSANPTYDAAKEGGVGLRGVAANPTYDAVKERRSD